MRFIINNATWQNQHDDLRQVREQVFIREQGVPAALEWDDQDATAAHVLARSTHGEAIGTARLLADGHIGRMAVLPAWRNHGVGSALLRALLDLARERGLSAVWLTAQVSAVGFYQRHGFIVQGEKFIEAGIPHQKMLLSLDGKPQTPLSPSSDGQNHQFTLC